jgi:MarR family transcriptional regulator for hemolysin
LADIVEIENMTLARHIDRLEEAGWVERRPDPDDRRAWLLYLSDSASPMFDHMRELIAETEAIVLAGFSKKDQAQMLDRLDIMKSNISRKDLVDSTDPGDSHVS